ncbi:MAG: DUF1491 family protein [Pseudomonadota bacterium]
MSEARLSADLWVMAYLARLNAEGIFAHVAKRGDPHAGSVAVKCATMDGQAQVFTRAYNAEGTRIWDLAHNGAESEAEDFLARQRKFDPDLWIIEVEDPRGRHLLDQPGLE